MDSLVGYGVSSESESDAEDSNIPVERVKIVDKDVSPLQKSRNFLLEADSASSASDGDTEARDDELDSPPSLRRPSSSQQPSLPTPFLQNKLPSPALNSSSDSSVFANPFKAQAEQKLSALQKHVPLTLQPKPTQIGGKRMCVSYRKDGRCRFGIKCKFAHDSDLQTDGRSSLGSEAPPQDTSDELVRSQETEVKAQQVKKRKAGLSNTLIPPKRAMKQFAMQRDRERLNMP